MAVAMNAPWDSSAAIESINALRAAGANAIAIIVFLWQPDPHSSALVRGGDISDQELAQAIRMGRRMGLRVLVKPHVWVPGHWAGEVRPRESELGHWFDRYRVELGRIARIAQAEGADALAIGIELKQPATRSEWERVIRGARAQFKGRLTYVAASMDEAETFAHWQRLDVVATSLYPRADDLDRWTVALERESARLIALASRVERPAWVAELGVRSMRGRCERHRFHAAGEAEAGGGDARRMSAADG